MKTTHKLLANYESTSFLIREFDSESKANELLTKIEEHKRNYPKSVIPRQDGKFMMAN